MSGGDTRPMIIKPESPSFLLSLILALPALSPLIVVPHFSQAVVESESELSTVSRVVFESTTALSVIFFLLIFALGYVHRTLQVAMLTLFLTFIAIGVALAATG